MRKFKPNSDKSHLLRKLADATDMQSRGGASDLNNHSVQRNLVTAP